MVERRGTGYQRLWNWFGLSHASFVILPRSMLHDMPDDWQERFAALLEEIDEEFPNGDGTDLVYYATAKSDGRYVRIPERFRKYRHTKPGEFDDLRNKG